MFDYDELSIKEFKRQNRSEKNRENLLIFIILNKYVAAVGNS